MPSGYFHVDILTASYSLQSDALTWVWTGADPDRWVGIKTGFNYTTGLKFTVAGNLRVKGGAGGLGEIYLIGINSLNAPVTNATGNIFLGNWTTSFTTPTVTYSSAQFYVPFTTGLFSTDGFGYTGTWVKNINMLPSSFTFTTEFHTHYIIGMSDPITHSLIGKPSSIVTWLG